MWILFATSNQGKIRDLSVYVKDSGIQLASPTQYAELQGLIPFGDEVEEIGKTYEENAALKSEAYFHWAGIPTLGDDSGLEVEALGGAPGLYSARYAGEGCSFADNINKLLREMDGVENRKAKFICTLAYTDATDHTVFFRGELEGVITEQPREGGGFGYDPIFEVAGTGKTLAEIKQSNEYFRTHRIRAMELLREHLRSR
ncbi:MAG: RdgB/HAM1 family non-canonical purine NTP pyrophosphatase [Bdellovibrionota bacterium]